MQAAVPVYLEIGSKRTFAVAVDWPGWCRSGRTEEDALQALVAYGPRYQAVVRETAGEFRPPASPGDLEVTERLKGDAGTDFGVPGKIRAGDERAVTEREIERLTSLLQACWAAFDAAAASAADAVLKKGPRGGGRELAAIVSHVFEAEKSYLRMVGGRYEGAEKGDPPGEMADLRHAVVDALSRRARGEPLPPRRSGSYWPPRYFVRRSAWHTLDHAWEIEDRAA
jgi:hypothetical protein